MEAKRMAGEAALQRVEDGMVLGLGTGSTVAYTLAALGARVKEGWDLAGVPTSVATEKLARSLGIPLTTLEEHPRLDLTIDGADEVDPDLNLVKGLGGALTREKIVASASDAMAVVVDASKVVEALGDSAPLPVEVLPFGRRWIQERVEALGCDATLRTDDGRPYVTDNGNHVLHCAFGRLGAPQEVARGLKAIPGVVEHGLFLGLADVVYVGGPEGVRTMQAPRRGSEGPR